MLFIKPILLALWQGLILGIHIGATVCMVCFILAFVIVLWVKLAKWCEKQMNPDRKAYKKAPKEPKVRNIMKTNKWHLN